MSDNLSNEATPLSTNPKGSPADGQKMRSDATGAGYTVSSQVTVGPIKPTDSKTLEGSYPGDHRTQAQGGTDPLKGNDRPVRSETSEQLEGVGG